MSRMARKKCTARQQRRPGRHIRGPDTAGNPAAIAAYRLSVAGLVPFLGAILGPIAVLWALVARWRWRKDRTIEGRPQIDAALMLGSFETIANFTALVFLYWDWSGS